jgi:EAL and modified HD-GYP domain-containing signal transduction protein
VHPPRGLLHHELYTLLPAERSVIELHETIEPDDQVIAACQRLKSQGYQLALDDFVYRPAFDPLLPMADVVKVDFQNPESRSPAALARLEQHPCRILAEKVETYEERAEAEQMGFDMFQGSGIR